MKFETKYGEVKLEITEKGIEVISTIPFKKERKSFSNLEGAKKFYNFLVEKIKKIIDELEAEKVRVMVEKNTLTKRLNKLIKVGAKKILLYGPTGTGKTFSLINLMEVIKKEKKIDNFLMMTFSSGMEDIDLLGKFLPQEDRSIKFDPSNLIKFIKENSSKKIAIIFDEFNRASSKMLNILIPMLDSRDEKVIIENYIKGETISIPADNVLFFFTANFGGSYSGTFHLDEAIMNRMDVALFVDYQEDIESIIIDKLKDKKKELANSLKDFFRDLYKKNVIHPFTTRDLKMLATLLETTDLETNSVLETILPILHKLVKTDNLGFIDSEFIDETKKLIDKKIKEMEGE